MYFELKKKTFNNTKEFSRIEFMKLLYLLREKKYWIIILVEFICSDFKRSSLAGPESFTVYTSF